MTTGTSFKQAWTAMSDRRLIQGMYRGCPKLTDNVLLNLEGDQHAERRAIMAPLFKTESIVDLEAEIASAIPGCLETMNRCGSADLVDLAEQFSLETAIRLVGLDASAHRQRLLELVRIFGQAATMQHSTEDPQGLEAKATECLIGFVSDYFDPAWGPIASPNNSVLSMLHASVERGDLSREQAIRDTAFSLQASIFSSANGAVHAFHEICQHYPEIEMRVNLATDPIRLQECLHEALRLHPASPVSVRLDPDQKDNPLVIDLEGANRDVAVFGIDADIFNPDRIHDHRWPYVGLTFGVGHHSCPGRELAAGQVRTRSRLGTKNNVGTLTRFLAALFELGVSPNPAEPPKASEITTRQIWASYPVSKISPGERL